MVGSPMRIAVSGSAVYVLSTTSACAPSVVAQVTGQGVVGIALDASSVYWAAADIARRSGVIRRAAR